MWGYPKGIGIKMQSQYSIWILSGALLINGCATLFSNPEGPINIQTDPPGAEVYLHAKKLGETPILFKLKNETLEQPFLVLKKSGYQTKRFDLEKIVNKTALFNLGFVTTSGGATSFGIDALTGSLLQYSPREYLVKLKKIDSIEPFLLPVVTATELAIVTVDNLRADIAKGGGPYLQAFHFARHMKLDYPSFQLIVIRNRDFLLKARNGLELTEEFSTLFGKDS